MVLPQALCFALPSKELVAWLVGNERSQYTLDDEQDASDEAEESMPARKVFGWELCHPFVSSLPVLLTE